MSLSKYIPKLNRFLQKRPLLLNSVTYGFFYTIAEFLQQTYNMSSSKETDVPLNVVVQVKPNDGYKSEELRLFRKFSETLGLSADKESSTEGLTYNWAQLKRYAIYGCFLAGPMLHGWYKWLDSYYRGTSIKIVLPKLCADQFLLTPVLLVVFFISTNLMEGKANIYAECQAKFCKTFQTSCIYWLPVQFANFTLIPPSLRVSFVSVAAFCWVNILCYLKRTPLTEYNEHKASVK